MKMSRMRIVASLLATGIIASALSGCSKPKVEKTPDTPTASASAPAAATYPIKSDVTLKWWLPLGNNINTLVKNQSETPFSQNLLKRTGVKVEYIHPPIGQEKEAFNILLASGDLPDIIENDWLAFPGGPNKAMGDGYIIKLNDAISKYAPNLTKYLKANPNIDKLVKTDEGSYYVFPFIRGDQKLLVSAGFVVREDWLKELNLNLPETIDEWYNVLKTFKDKKGATAPMSTTLANIQFFMGAFNSFNNFYQDGGKIKYGPIEPARKQFLTAMKKWYDEGLLDKNFATVDSKTIDANILGGKSGATYGSGGSGIGKWMQSMAGKDDKYSLAGTKFPSPTKGTKPEFGGLGLNYQSTSGTAAITGKSKNIELAARLLDYGYSEEGQRFYNFGEENESYKMVNGLPIYTDLIMKNPNKWTTVQAMSMYSRAPMNGPFIQDKGYIEQYYELKQQKEGLARWEDHDFAKHILPTITPTKEESSEMSKIMNDINTYRDEMTIKFIMGSEPLDNYDKYIDQMKKLGIERAIQINQAALERFNKR
jgi:putative aldouronate transport system substrate-binding protein